MQDVASKTPGSPLPDSYNLAHEIIEMKQKFEKEQGLFLDANTTLE